MNEADLIVVTDTGSDDGTVEKLREKGAIVYINDSNIITNPLHQKGVCNF